MIDYISVALGLLLLVYSATIFVSGAANIAKYFKVPLFFIGFLIVGIGTSAPEMIVSGMSSFNGNTGLAIGNALGSNITNIALVLGVTAIVSPIIVDKNSVKTQLPLLFIFSTVAYYLFLDNELSKSDGMLLISCMIFYLYLLFKMTPRNLIEENDVEILEKEGIDIPDDMSVAKSIALTFAGMMVLYLGSKMLTFGAANIAKSFGISDLVIGLTVIAIGTSLPELSASIAAALRKQHELAFGNIVGSNMFNTLLVLAIPGVISPGDVPSVAVIRDFSIVIGLTVLMLIYCNSRMIFAKKHEGMAGKGNFTFEAIGRKEGFLMLLFFIAYETMIYMHS